MGKTTGFMEYGRVEEGYKPVAERLKHYKEFVVGLDEGQAKVQGARCMDCGTPFCNSGCPVNSGKLLVECSTSIAFFQSPRNTRSLKSGMMLFTGQPLLQKGVPQSMQRALCTLDCSSLSVMTNSFQFFTRWGTGS